MIPNITAARFGIHQKFYEEDRALRTAVSLSKGTKTSNETGAHVGVYQEGYHRREYHVVSETDLDKAIARKQPHLVILQAHNQLDESMHSLYGQA